MIACIGGAHLDRHGVVRGPLLLGTSNPGRVHEALGGVARNVAENLARLGAEVNLVSRVGDDAAGRRVREHAGALGIETSLCSVSAAQPTACYTAILENTGELAVGLADMEIYEELMPEILAPALPTLLTHARWFIDSNVPGGTIEWLLTSAGAIPVAVDAISVAKARRLVPLLTRIPLLFANLAQAAVLAEIPVFEDVHAAARSLQERGVRSGVVSSGADGIAVWTDGGVRTFRALPATPRNVTGAGDALMAGTLFGLMRGVPLEEAAQLGLAAAAIAVESPQAVAPQLTAGSVEARRGAA